MQNSFCVFQFQADDSIKAFASGRKTNRKLQLIPNLMLNLPCIPQREGEIDYVVYEP